jgi:hypothetical protein
MKYIFLILFYLKYSTQNDKYIFNLDSDNTLSPSSWVTGTPPFECNKFGPSVQTLTGPFDFKTGDKQTDLKLAHPQYDPLGFFYIPKLNFNDVDSGNNVPYCLGIDACESCLIFDYLNATENTSDTIQCEFTAEGATYDRIYMVKPTIVKNLQINTYNIQLADDGQVYVTTASGYTDINMKKITEYISDKDFSNDNAVGVYTHYFPNQELYYLTIDARKYIYIYIISGYKLGSIKFDQFDKIDKVKNKITELTKITQVSFDHIRNITNLYLEGEQAGIYQFKQVDIGLYNITHIKEANFNGETIGLDIIDAYVYTSGDINKAFILIRSYGVLMYDLVSLTVISIFRHPFIYKLDQIENSDYIFLGLFTNNTPVDELFIEVTIDPLKFDNFYINRVYLSKMTILSAKTDTKMQISHIASINNIYMISRNQINQKMTAVYGVNIGFGDIEYHPISSDAWYLGVIYTNTSLTGISLPTSYFSCSFYNPGDYTASLSTYFNSQHFNLEETIVQFKVSGRFPWVVVCTISAFLGLLVIAWGFSKACRTDRSNNYTSI